MRFAQHLSSHLTPEWRKHYIDYDDLKKRIYEMVGGTPGGEDGEDDEDSNAQEGWCALMGNGGPTCTHTILQQRYPNIQWIRNF